MVTGYGLLAESVTSSPYPISHIPNLYFCLSDSVQFRTRCA
jgi:hypothetical protein